MRTHLPDVIVPVLNTVVLPRLRTSFEILARANGTPTEELDRAWEEVQLSVAKGGSNIGGHADVADACFVAAFLAVWPSLRDRRAYQGHALAVVPRDGADAEGGEGERADGSAVGESRRAADRRCAANHGGGGREVE